MAGNGIIARKVGMTRMVDPSGQMIAVTLLEIVPQQVTKVLSKEKDGYEAVQVGYWVKPEHRMNKPDTQRLRKAGVEQNFTRFKEFRGAADVAVGAALNTEGLDGVTAVDVTGITKGRGFQDPIFRWGFSRGRETHGSTFHRRTGSLGMRTTPGRVFKGKKMPGHMGNARRTMLNLTVVHLDKDQSLLALKGSVPGHNNSYLFVRPSIK